MNIKHLIIILIFIINIIGTISFIINIQTYQSKTQIKYNINNVFDEVYLINLEREPEKLKVMKEKLNKHNIKYKLIKAIDGSKIKNIKLLRYGNAGAVGIKKTQIKIIQEAKQKKYNKILILEDDLLFINNFETLFDHYYKQIMETDSDWKLLYLGCSYRTPQNFSFLNYVHTKSSYGNFAVGVDSRVYDVILKSKDDNRPIDDIFVEDIQSNYKSLVMKPQLITAEVRKKSTTDGYKISNHYYYNNNVNIKNYK